MSVTDLPTIDPATLLKVNGKIETTTTTYPDYVFENYFDGTSKINSQYAFKSLKETEKFIIENKHLLGTTGIKDLKKNDKGEYI
ncbi:hypothetical protein [Chryseobacterium cucumeris]|uniref:hypothetical protein n=1 Tax=Chryseobacterium cucumeris TaxID=1813611 RepID=UPI001E4C7E90|nr:hypothetical protein [Chryseobacterium cucumeris]